MVTSAIHSKAHEFVITQKVVSRLLLEYRNGNVPNQRLVRWQRPRSHKKHKPPVPALLSLSLLQSWKALGDFLQEALTVQQPSDMMNLDGLCHVLEAHHMPTAWNLRRTKWHWHHHPGKLPEPGRFSVPHAGRRLPCGPVPWERQTGQSPMCFILDIAYFESVLTVTFMSGDKRPFFAYSVITVISRAAFSTIWKSPWCARSIPCRKQSLDL